MKISLINDIWGVLRWEIIKVEIQIPEHECRMGNLFCKKMENYSADGEEIKPDVDNNLNDKNKWCNLS